MGVQRLRICLCLVAALSVGALSQEQSFQRFATNDGRPFSQTSSSNFHGASNQRAQEDFQQLTVDAERTKIPRPHIRRPTEHHFASNDNFVNRQQNVFLAPAVQQPAVHVVSNFPPQQQQQQQQQQQPAFHHRTGPQHQQDQTDFFASQQTLRPVSVEQLNAQRTQSLRHQSGNFQQSQRPVTRPVSHPQLTAVQDDSFHQRFQQPSTTIFSQHPSFQPVTTSDTAVRHNLGFGLEQNSQNRGSTTLGSAAEINQFQDNQQQQRRPAAKRPSDELAEDELIRKQQAENAKYSFQTSVTDTINDHQIVREEKRDGLKLTGAYSYSDGFYKRTVFYEADENGYRVVKEESEPIGSGPQLNPDGKVDVSTSIGGSKVQYTVTADDIPALSSDAADVQPHSSSTFV